MRTRVALLACLSGLAPALALGQAAGEVTITESSTSSQGGLSDRVINIAECNGTVSGDSVTLQWNLALPPNSLSAFYRIYATTGSCPDSGGLPTTGFHEISSAFQGITTQAGNWTTPINVRTDLVAPLGISCSAAATVTFCVLAFDTNTADAKVQSTFTAKGSIAVDTVAPGQPTSVSAASGDGALTVAWAAGSGTATTWLVTATGTATDNPTLACSGGGVLVSKSCSGSTTTSCRITGLTNDACYDVTVQGFSASQNPSPVSAAAAGVPRPMEDFWERYQSAGGRELGGCSGGAASGLALLALAALAPRLKRRRP